MVPEESLFTIAGGGAGRNGVWADGRHHGKYADLVDAAAVRAGLVHVLHGAARGTGAAEAGPAIPDAFLPDDFRGRRVGWGFRGADRAAGLPLVLRNAAGAGVVRGAGAVCAEPGRRSGAVVPRMAVDSAGGGRGRDGGDGHVPGDADPGTGTGCAADGA